MRIERGYAVIERPREYDSLKVFADLQNPTAEQQEYINLFAKTFSFLKTRQYRGISRLIIEGWKPGLNLQNPESPDWELEARAELRRLSPDFEGFTFEDPWLLASSNNAKSVVAKLARPSDYEIVYLYHESTLLGNESASLGYDIGYWQDSDHFSLIADCIGLTRWHTPGSEKLAEVAEKIRNLNENILFSTSEEANAFRDYYLTQEWGETENYRGEFAVIQLCDPSS
jgi:hypothetical protein